MQTKAYVIGVTGNTGAGKSTAAYALHRAGVCIVDADEIARELQRPGQPALEEIAQTFGDQMLNDDGSLNRRKLGALVFTNAELLKKLDNIMLPLILREIHQRIAQSKEDIVIDAALLFETGMQVLCDETWLIVAPEDVRRQRIMKRDNLPLEQAQARIQSQMPQEEKRKLATHVLDGGKEPRHLERQAIALYEEAVGKKREA